MCSPAPVFRLGGLVQAGSVKRAPDLVVRFSVTDGNTSVPVSFKGLLAGPISVRDRAW